LIQSSAGRTIGESSGTLTIAHDGHTRAQAQSHASQMPRNPNPA
jgi:hypothetical protein